MDCDPPDLERCLPGEGNQFDRCLFAHLDIALPQSVPSLAPTQGFNGPYEETLADAG